ncbi:hypothetical protein CFP65_3673 [Kitasatospora sp. MMS16-BH015]|uniref:DUF6282 family protein n=1 Tax=Kitasatospora sp. MMS16-BH015 TaxID=2018025 RepID=UPI000CA34646|nr:DUF6282 family protein [Kitasatospora sp. MMS16-BH015]AUG78461.1 hypothetical protein CFP65_3673 [Kitasatospora sp. MMS16-BH015]
MSGDLYSLGLGPTDGRGLGVPGTAGAAGPRLADAAFVDVHYHADPDAYRRRHSAVAAGRRYAEHGGWVVLKNHLGCTAAQAREAREQGQPVSGSTVLNSPAGGLDPQVVLGSYYRHGDGGGARLIVHLPTVTGRPHTSRLARDPGHPHLAAHPMPPLTVSEEDGRLRPVVLEILRMAKDLDLVVSTGHASGDEVRRLVDAAVELELPALMLNQPASPMTGLRYRDLAELALAPMVYTEQTALTYLLGYQSEEDFRQVLTLLPRTVYSSDLGQPSQPDVADWLALSASWFARFGLDPQRVREITRDTPAQLLGLGKENSDV